MAFTWQPLERNADQGIPRDRHADEPLQVLPMDTPDRQNRLHLGLCCPLDCRILVLQDRCEQTMCLLGLNGQILTSAGTLGFQGKEERRSDRGAVEGYQAIERCVLPKPKETAVIYHAFSRSGIECCLVMGLMHIQANRQRRGHHETEHTLLVVQVMPGIHGHQTLCSMA